MTTTNGVVHDAIDFYYFRRINTPARPNLPNIFRQFDFDANV